jgi:hypothetical protein
MRKRMRFKSMFTDYITRAIVQAASKKRLEGGTYPPSRQKAGKLSIS